MRISALRQLAIDREGFALSSVSKASDSHITKALRSSLAFSAFRSLHYWIGFRIRVGDFVKEWQNGTLDPPATVSDTILTRPLVPSPVKLYTPGQARISS